HQPIRSVAGRSAQARDLAPDQVSLFRNANVSCAGSIMASRRLAPIRLVLCSLAPVRSVLAKLAPDRMALVRSARDRLAPARLAGHSRPVGLPSLFLISTEARLAPRS